MTAFAATRDEDSAAFFDGARNGCLMIRRCPRCEHLRPPFIARGLLTGGCDRCGHGHLEWVAALGTGTLVTWTTSNSPDKVDCPTLLGIVELTEGPWIFARLVEVSYPPEIGAAMKVAFIRPGGGEYIPVFHEVVTRDDLPK